MLLLKNMGKPNLNGLKEFSLDIHGSQRILQKVQRRESEPRPLLK